MLGLSPMDAIIVSVCPPPLDLLHARCMLGPNIESMYRKRGKRARDVLLPARLFLRAIHVCTSILTLQTTKRHSDLWHECMIEQKQECPCTPARTY